MAAHSVSEAKLSRIPITLASAGTKVDLVRFYEEQAVELTGTEPVQTH